MKLVSNTAFIILALLILIPASALADRNVVEEVTVESKGAIQKGSVILWIGEEKFTRIDELNKITTIVRHDLNKMYLVFADRKEAIEIALPFTLPDYLEPLFKEVKMSWDINRQPGSKKTIGKWKDCTRVLIRGRGVLNIDMELWISPDTGVDTRAFHTMVSESLQTSALYREMGEKLYSLSPNFSIRTTTTVEQMGLSVKTVSEVKKIEIKDAPEGIYEVPEGFEVKQLDFAAYLSLIRERQPEIKSN